MSLHSAKLKLARGDINGGCDDLRALLAEADYPKSIKDEAESLLDEHKWLFDNDKETSSRDNDGYCFWASPQRLPRKTPYRCTVLCWDVNHNCLGRAYLIKEVASRVFEHVHLMGFAFTHISQSIWRPLEDSQIEITILPEPETAEEMHAVARSIAEFIDTDLIIACKPRLPTLLIAAYAKQLQGIPFIVDIDDYERGFFKSDIRSTLDSGLSADLFFMGSRRIKERPYSYFWTRIAEQLICFADYTITSNTSLQRLYGGSIIPHVRDEEKFTSIPRYGIPDGYSDFFDSSTRLVVFLGTPHRHKGIAQLASACSASKTEGLKLVIIGSFRDEALKKEVLASGGQRVHLINDIPLSEVPRFLSPASLVILLQDQESEASRYQLPAKAIDAIGLGIPILATDTEPMKMLCDMGCKNITFIQGLENLSQQIDSALAYYGGNREFSEPTRRAFSAKLTIASGAETLKKAVQHNVFSSNREIFRGHLIHALYQALDRLFPGPPSLGPSNSDVGKEPEEKILHVIIWKQNDFGIYGRRVDMLADYLSSRSDVHEVLVFEPALTSGDMVNLRNSGMRHHQLIFSEALAKSSGLRSLKKLKSFSIILPKGLNSEDKAMAYTGYIGNRIKASTISSFFSRRPRIVLWIYPYCQHVDLIHKEVSPDLTICDVVDDHRAWPEITDEKINLYNKNYQSCFDLSDLIIFNNRHTASGFAKSFELKSYSVIENGVDMSIASQNSYASREIRHHLLSTHGAEGIIGYAGNLEAKIDWPLIDKIAKANPNYIIVLIGSRHMSVGASRERNVVHVDSVRYSELKGYLGAFDVAIIPHKLSEQTKSMNPLKAYVYLGQKIPVVATSLPNLPLGAEAFPQFRVCKDHAEFLGQLSDVLANRVKLLESFSEIDSYIRQASWSNRFAPLLDLVHSSLLRDGTA